MVAAYNLEAADDFVEGNKIGWNHLAGGWSSQNVYMCKPRNGLLGQKMRHHETFLVV